ncbi:MAG: FtsX-like permease family protein, partial [Gemmataceae bacterium]
ALAYAPDCQVISGCRLGISVRMSISGILLGAAFVSLASLMAVTLMVGVVYTGMLSERSFELGFLLAIGMRPKALRRLIITEAGFATGLGGAIGVLLGGLSLVAFQRSLGFTLLTRGIPFVFPGLPELGIHATASIMLCALVGTLGAWVPAFRAGRTAPARLIRGEAA